MKGLSKLQIAGVRNKPYHLGTRHILFLNAMNIFEVSSIVIDDHSNLMQPKLKITT